MSTSWPVLSLATLFLVVFLQLHRYFSTCNLGLILFDRNKKTECFLLHGFDAGLGLVFTGFADADLPHIHRIARMAILLHDAGLMQGSFTWADLLKDCVSTLGTANSRSYLPLHRSLQVTEFLIALHWEAGSKDKSGAYSSHWTNWLGAVST